MKIKNSLANYWGGSTSIGEYAFNGCSSLETVDFPNATSIGEYAFVGCVALIEADFPYVTSIGSNAFLSCANLTTANFPAVTSIGSDAFYVCFKLDKVTLGTIAEANWDAAGTAPSTPGDLRTMYFAQPEGSRAGKYVTSNPGWDAVWTKEP